MQCISFELRAGGKCCKSTYLYRSPSLMQVEFETFFRVLKNFELTLDKILESNPFMTIILGDFNAKSKNWCKNDTTSLEYFMIHAEQCLWFESTYPEAQQHA